MQSQTKEEITVQPQCKVYSVAVGLNLEFLLHQHFFKMNQEETVLCRELSSVLTFTNYLCCCNHV